MRADLAPFAIDFAMAFGGLGLLVAFRIVDVRASSMAAAFGLAYLTGAAVIPLVLSVLLVIGIPFTLVTFAVVTLVCIGFGVVLGARSPRLPHTKELWWKQPWRSWPADRWIVALFVIAFGTFAVAGFLDAFQLPLLGWDSLAFYARKAEMLTYHDSLIHSFFAAPTYGFIHQDYPLQLPVFEALHFRAAGTVDIQAVLRHNWLLLVAFVWSAAYLLRDRVRPLVWAPLLLLAALAPGVWQQLLEGNADVPMAIFAGIGAIAMALWVSEGREGDGRPYLALGAAMVAAAGNTKNEGLMVAVAILLVTGVVALLRGLRLRDFLIACGAVVIVELPWRIWMSANGVETEFSLSKGLNPGYLFHHASRIWPSIRTLGHELSDQSRWLYLLPLAVLVVLAALISGTGRRVAAFYAAVFGVICAGFIWNYWASELPIGWYLETSADRIISVLVFICIAAVVHLSGLLLNALMRPSVGSAVDGDDGPSRDRERPLGSRAPEGSSGSDGLDVRAVPR
jgi:hypothetical protein